MDAQAMETAALKFKAQAQAKTVAIEHAQKWCEANYENGADCIVECWDDADWDDLWEDHGSFTGMLNELEALADTHRDKSTPFDFLWSPQEEKQYQGFKVLEQAKTDAIEQAKTDAIEQAKTDAIEQAKKWCEDNYENGTDCIIECWGPDNWEELWNDHGSFIGMLTGLAATATEHIQEASPLSFLHERRPY